MWLGYIIGSAYHDTKNTGGNYPTGYEYKGVYWDAETQTWKAN
jgi:hypothetical protein